MHLHFKRDSIAKLNLHLVIFWVSSLDMTRDCVSWRFRRKEKKSRKKKKRDAFSSMKLHLKINTVIISFEKVSKIILNEWVIVLEILVWNQNGYNFPAFFFLQKCSNFQFLAVKIFQIANTDKKLFKNSSSHPTHEKLPSKSVL